jgi:hypothetical protein
MDPALPLEKMSVQEKLRVLQLLWEDLTRVPSDMPAPDWHRDVLDAREQRVQEGREKFIPWSEAKKDLRASKP